MSKNQEHYKDWCKYEDEEEGSWYNAQRQGCNKDCLKQEDEQEKEDDIEYDVYSDSSCEEDCDDVNCYNPQPIPKWQKPVTSFFPLDPSKTRLWYRVQILCFSDCIQVVTDDINDDHDTIVNCADHDDDAQTKPNTML